MSGKMDYCTLGQLRVWWVEVNHPPRVVWMFALSISWRYRRFYHTLWVRSPPKILDFKITITIYYNDLFITVIILKIKFCRKINWNSALDFLILLGFPNDLYNFSYEPSFHKSCIWTKLPFYNFTCSLSFVWRICQTFHVFRIHSLLFLI